MLNLRLPIPRFLSAGEVFSGNNSLAALKALDASKVAVLVTNAVAKRHALLDTLRVSIQANELHFIALSQGEPSLAEIRPALAQVNDFQPDWIVAVGGGSALDAAKLIWTLYEHPELTPQQLARPFSIPKLRGKCRLVAVPTTAGTGSEVSSSALILDDQTGRKFALVSHELLPDIAILDPLLNRELPREVIAFSGLDALTHAVEGYVSKYKNSFIDHHAEKATQIILTTLPKLLEQPQDDALRLKMMEASLMAGWVHNHVVTGIAHAVAHQMGHFDIPHGFACGQLLGASIEVNAMDSKVRDRYTALFESAGLSDGIDEFQARLRVLVNDSSLAELKTNWDLTLRSLTAQQREFVVEGSLKDICARANPIRMDAALVESLFEKVV